MRGIGDFHDQYNIFLAIRAIDNDIGIRAIKDVVMALVIDVLVICLFRAYFMDH